MLDTLIAAGLPRIHYWRDKQQREVDFVVPRGRETVDAIECKWRPDELQTRGLSAFRANYPKGRNLVVSPIEGRSYQRRKDGMELTVMAPAELRRALSG